MLEKEYKPHGKLSHLERVDDDFGNVVVGIYEKSCLERAGDMIRLKEPSELEATGWKFRAR